MIDKNNIAVFGIREKNRKYPRLGILSPIGVNKYPVDQNTSNWGLGISEPGKAKWENKSPIPNWLKLPQWPILDYPRDAGEGSAVDRPISLHSTWIKAVASKGAHLFHLIILYYCHRGSWTFVFIQARLHPAPVDRIRCNLFSLENNKCLCSLCGCKKIWLYQR